MQQYFQKLLLALICTLGIYNIGFTQMTHNVKNTQDIDIKLLGTSTLHAWEMDALNTRGAARFVFKTDDTSDLDSIKSLSFTLQVADLKSDNKGLDKNAYAALKSEEFKDIRYQLTSSTLSSEEGGYLVKSTGKLTIAGVTKAIVMDVHCVNHTDGTITFKGSYMLKMTDYQVEPPSFMWGVMKTGDDITLDFVVVYQKEKGA